MDRQLIDDTLILLAKLKNQLSVISQDDFNRKDAMWDNSSLGAHVRHILEFYGCLLKGIKDKSVNYDERERNQEIENNLDTALSYIDFLSEKIGKLDYNAPLNLSSQYNLENNRSNLSTNLERELVYLMDHSIHHQSIIRYIIRSYDRNIPLADDFGFAYSTLANKLKE